MGEKNIRRLYENKGISQFLNKDKIIAPAQDHCPRCQIALAEIQYEGTPVLRCVQCQGTLIQGDDVRKIIIREDFSFSDRVKQLARSYQPDQEKFLPRKLNLKAAPLLVCPKCRSRGVQMVHNFYSDAYRIEVDYCYCGCMWFDKDELELLQYLIEENVKKHS